MPRKKKAQGGHGNSERWLLTYADMITLLVAFFVMLYAMSILDMKKFQAVAGVLRMNFGGSQRNAPVGESLILPGLPDGPNLVVGEEDRAKKIEAIAGQFKQLVQSQGLGAKVVVLTQKRGVIVRFAAEGMLFERGKADLDKAALPVLDKLADIIDSTGYSVRVEGHTCDLPISTARFPSNWELSASRAGTVVRHLASRGLRPERLSAVGYADAHPVASNDSEKNRVKNRRVDIMVLDSETKLAALK